MSTASAPSEIAQVSKPAKKRRWKPILLKTLAVIFILWLGFVGMIWWSMNQAPERFATVMSYMPGPVVFLMAPFETMWMRARAGTLHPGAAAPDFNLQTLDKTSYVSLSSLNAKGPVVLVFGSYT